MKLKRLHTLIRNPEQYHGEIISPPFFEGWYFKVVTSDQKNAYAFIPGVSYSPDGSKDHAFIQVLDGNSGTVAVKEFSIDAFSAASDRFEIQLGENHFNSHQMRLDLLVDGRKFKGEMSFDLPISWPKTFLSPGIMGPFGWLWFLECNHGVLSLDHPIQGALVVDDRTIDFTGGRGYIEKDWGKSFPSEWIWMQSNHFSIPGTSLTFSWASIPFGLFQFKGVIAGLWHNGVLHPFTTYQGVRVTVLRKEVDLTEILLKQGRKKLWVKALREKSGSLNAPTTAGMNRRIMESLDARLHVKMWVGKDLVFDEVGYRGGLEIVNQMIDS